MEMTAHSSYTAARRITLAIAVVTIVLASLVAAHVASAGTVTVSVSVGERLEATFTDTGVIVRSNAPWQLTADVPGEDPILITGGPVNGQNIVLPKNAEAVYVCTR